MVDIAASVHRVTVILKVLATPPSIGTLHRREDGALELAVTIGELTAPSRRHIVVDEGQVWLAAGSGRLRLRAGLPECQSPKSWLRDGAKYSGLQAAAYSLQSRVSSG